LFNPNQKSDSFHDPSQSAASFPREELRNIYEEALMPKEATVPKVSLLLTMDEDSCAVPTGKFIKHSFKSTENSDDHIETVSGGRSKSVASVRMGAAASSGRSASLVPSKAAPVYMRSLVSSAVPESPSDSTPASTGSSTGGEDNEIHHMESSQASGETPMDASQTNEAPLVDPMEEGVAPVPSDQATAMETQVSTEGAIATKTPEEGTEGT
jgi:hypothetical protein